MANKGVSAPRLPAAPVEYDKEFIDALLSILRQYFNGLDNPGPIIVSTQRTPATSGFPAHMISALRTEDGRVGNDGKIAVAY